MLFKAIVLAAVLIVSIEGHLRDQAKQKYIGTAMAAHALTDGAYKTMAGQEFNSASPENEMKWGFLEPSKGNYAWDNADKLVAYAQEHGMKFRGHTFLWHNRIPEYAQKLEGKKAELAKVVKDHITTVANHFKGKIYAWDVVNEVIDGTKIRDSLFSRTLGAGFIEEAFRTAHAADPNAKLYINDFGIESKNSKSDYLYKLVKEWKAKGVPVHGVGMQAHFREGSVPASLQENIKRFSDLGLDVAITELNIRYKLPGSQDKINKQTQDYAHAFQACMNVERCVGVTVWGFTDKYSNIFDQGYGEQELWTKDYKPKPAVAAVDKGHLRDQAKHRYIGTALSKWANSDTKYWEIAGQEFNCGSPENEMKWAQLESSKGNYNWADADKLVEFAHKHNMSFRGHTFLWHDRIPDYAMKLDGKKSELNKVVQDHIKTVASHFKGKIYAWDVVNEVLNEDGSGNKLRDSLFSRTLGIEFIEQAFRTAHAVDPNAKLYINDYGIEGKCRKSDALYSLVKGWLAKGVPLHGVGMQSHFRVGGVPETLHDNIKRFADLGIDVAITELNVRIKMPPSATDTAQQTKDYEHAVSTCMSVDRCVGVTVWGFTDKYSDVFDKGYGVQQLWTDKYNPKPAVQAISKTFFIIGYKNNLFNTYAQGHLRNQAKHRYIGTALSKYANSDTKYWEIAGQEFNSGSPENEIKWSLLETSKGNYNWTDADKLVEFAHKHNMSFRGHTFLWHKRIPDYAMKLDGKKSELDKVVQDHIKTVAGHFKGKIYAWDVVNEVLNEDGSGNKLRDSLFSRTLGVEFIEQAFHTAHAVDPNAKLYINDYGIEGKCRKSDALYSLVKGWLAKKVPIHGVGMQAHFRVGGVPATLHDNIKRFADLGLDVAITELNVRIKMPPSGTDTAQQTKDYEHAVSTCMSVDRCVGVTVWGFTDKYSDVFDKGYGVQ
ncbi:unnamed protein product, partial [Medioppia subpectinata]